MTTSLWGLFFSALISSSLLPGGSEVVLVWLLNQQHHPVWLLVTIATIGNTLGAMTSWGIGRYAANRLGTDFAAKHQTAINRIQRHGAPILLFSWLPLVGDALCVAAGWLKLHWLPALCFIALGKTLRYTVLVMLF